MEKEKRKTTERLWVLGLIHLAVYVAAFVVVCGGCGSRCGGPNRQDPQPAECKEDKSACAKPPVQPPTKLDDAVAPSTPTVKP